MTDGGENGRNGTGLLTPPHTSHILPPDSREQDVEVDGRLGQYVSRLGRMSTQLKQTSTQIEDSVVEVCASFQGIAERAKAAVARTVSFLGQDGGRGSAKVSFEVLIQNCGETLVRILNATLEAGEVSRRAVERIQQMDEAAATIRAAILQLEEISKENKMLVINARIEAAHAGQQGAGFAVVAVEVASQTEKMQKVTGLVDTLASDLRTLAASTLTDLQRMSTREQERVTQCRQEVDDSLKDLRSAHGEMKDMLMGMTEDGALLASDIGSAVRGLQFQDRVSQRIAHVIEDLELIQQRVATNSGHGSPGGAHIDEGFSKYTMHEEREVAGMHKAEGAGGDVELF
jgi:methyl-accepting chemotaxis protein